MPTAWSQYGFDSELSLMPAITPALGLVRAANDCGRFALPEPAIMDGFSTAWMPWLDYELNERNQSTDYPLSFADPAKMDEPDPDDWRWTQQDLFAAVAGSVQQWIGGTDYSALQGQSASYTSRTAALRLEPLMSVNWLKQRRGLIDLLTHKMSQIAISTNGSASSYPRIVRSLAVKEAGVVGDMSWADTPFLYWYGPSGGPTFGPYKIKINRLFAGSNVTAAVFLRVPRPSTGLSGIFENPFFNIGWNVINVGTGDYILDATMEEGVSISNIGVSEISSVVIVEDLTDLLSFKAD